MIMITDTPLFVMNAAESCSINITCEGILFDGNLTHEDEICNFLRMKR